MAANEKRQAIIFFTVMIIIIAVMLSLPSSMRDQALDLQCKHRLKRLGDAVNYWVYDNGFRGFPQIKNPQPFTAWDPNRQQSTSNILREYLGGNIEQKRHEGESQGEYIERLRKKELSVDPVTGFEFWYNSVQLNELDVRKISQAPEHHAQELQYFRCQRYADDSAPYELDDASGIYANYGIIIHRVVNAKDVEELRQKLNDIETQNKNKSPSDWSHDLLFLRERVKKYEASIAAHPEGFPAITIDTDVRFLAEP